MKALRAILADRPAACGSRQDIAVPFAEGVVDLGDAT